MSVSEGFNIVGSRPYRDNNPLDLMWCAEAKRFGATHGDLLGGPHSFEGSDGFAVFPDAPTGWRAGKWWLSVPAIFHNGLVPGHYLDPNGKTLVAGYLGATFAQLIYRFAPPSQNNTEAYIAGCISRCPGLTRSTIITHDLLETPEAL
jgi:hypothetical protein